MNKRIFPAEIVENSQESNFSSHSVKSKIIYSVIILFVFGVFALLPLIEVEVGVRGQGLIRPVTELVQVTAPVSGPVELLQAAENSRVSRGELFAVIEAPQLAERMRFNENRRRKLSRFIGDLEILQSAGLSELTGSITLSSPWYRQNHAEFRQQLLNQEREINRLKRNLEREETLFDMDALSRADLDESLFSYKTAISRFELLYEQQRNTWKQEEISFRDELDERLSEYRQLEQEQSRYRIHAPVAGTVQNLNSIFQNSFIYANQVLAEISPDTSLVAETYVSPRDIGLLKEGMPVRIQVDAYNHNQWGTATGKVKNISGDVIMSDNRPLFRVRCSLDQTWLELPNGYRGEIKKGMTFQARFIVTHRSLFQLLFDKADDWLNPLWGKNEQQSQTAGLE